VSDAAEDGASQGGVESHADAQRQLSANHIEQRQRVHGAKWFGANQGVMPQVTLGMRDGPLVPPRGSLVSRTGMAASRAVPLRNAARRPGRGPIVPKRCAWRGCRRRRARDDRERVVR
jgi:hypothetical protein